MESISEITNSALQGNVLERLSAQIRENPSAIKRGLEHAVPTSLAGLSSYASSENRAAELLGAFRGGDYPHVSASDVQNVVGDPAATARVSQEGCGFMGRIFGDKQTAVVDAIAKQSGLTRSGASTVLGLATPLVLNAVGRETESRNLDARGLSRFLADQGHSISGSLPGPLQTAIGGLGVAGIAGATTHAIHGVHATTTDVPRGASEAPRGTMSPMYEAKDRAAEAKERAHEAKLRAHEAKERARTSASDTLHRAHLAGHERTHEPHARRGIAWKLIALAVLAIAALFMFSRRNNMPDMPKVSTPELPKASAPAVENRNTPTEDTQRQQEQRAQQQGQQGEQQAQPQQQQAQPQQEAQPQQQQAQPTAEQPAGVTAESLSVASGAGALTAFLDGSGTLPKRFVLEDIQFATGSSSVPSNTMLDDVATALKNHPDTNVRLDGYADSTGDAAENAVLSTARADAVKQYLVDKGANPGNIETTGEASDRPVASNDTDQGRAQNRRVELVVTERG